MKKIVIAVGGNSLISAGQRGFIEEQKAAAYETCKHIADMIGAGNQLVIAHGNGPQVGNILLRNDAGEQLHGIPQMPMDICGADSQGGIGYMLSQALINILRAKKIKKGVVTVVTQCVVDRNDEAFKNPRKPVGPFYKADQVEQKRKDNPGWTIIEDAGRGYRRVVASPIPGRIVEQPAIEILVNSGQIVIAVGGGGIPVIEKENGDLEGIAAVIDKDNASCVLANNIKADIFMISTDVPQVFINFKKPDQQGLSKITVSEAKKHLADGQFAKGSMEPKIKASIKFVESGGEMAIITNPPSLMKALNGQAGTRITND
jgi:carbamate kinase